MYARVDKYTAEEKQNTESRIGLIKTKKNARKMQKKNQKQKIEDRYSCEWVTRV